MALSGRYFFYKFKDVGLYVEWSATQSVSGNYSDVTQRIYLSHYALSISARDNGKSTINKTTVTFKTPSISYSGGSLRRTLLYTHKVRVPHDSSGRAQNIKLAAEFYLGATLSGVKIDWLKTDTVITLDNIDVSPPTVSCSITNVTNNSCTITGTTSTTCNQWWYRLNDNEAWIKFSTASSTRQSVNVTGLSSNRTYKITVSARKKTNNKDGYSSPINFKTLGASILRSVRNINSDSSTVRIPIEVTVNNTGFAHSLQIKRGDSTILTISNLKLVNGLNTITLNSSQRTTLLNGMTDTDSFYATYVLTTFEGGTQVGAESSARGYVNTSFEDSAPTFKGFTYKDVNTNSTAITKNNQILIQNVSDLRVLVNEATPKNGATIKNYKVSFANVSATSLSEAATMAAQKEIIVGRINASGDKLLTVSAVDSRGYTVSIQKSVKIVPYEMPEFSSIDLRRKNEVEKLIELTFRGSFSGLNIDGSGNKNALHGAYYWIKPTSSGDWGNPISILDKVKVTGTSFSYENKELAELDENGSYDLFVRVLDKFHMYPEFRCEQFFHIVQGIPVVAIRGRSSQYQFPRVGINNNAPKFPLDVKGTIAQNGFPVLGYVGELDAKNLNDVTEMGIYAQSDYRNATPKNNYPFDTHTGYLVNLSNIYDRLVQVYITRNGQHIATRMGGDTPFEKWNKFDLDMPHIVEEKETTFGERGSWSYRKWSNGTCELWLRDSVDRYVDTKWNSVFYGTAIGGYKYPFTFKEVPTEVITMQANGAAVGWYTEEGHTPSTTNVGYYIPWRPGTYANPIRITFSAYIKGKI